MKCIGIVLLLVDVAFAWLKGNNAIDTFKNSFHIHTLTNDNFESMVLHSNASVWLVNFFAPWVFFHVKFNSNMYML